jgi:BCD family chlorophyll transporter-like MFS transporter
VLLSGFAVAGILYSRLMPEYSPAAFRELVTFTMGVSALAWFFSVWREERAISGAEASDPQASGFGDLVRTMLAKPNARDFFWLLSAGAIAAFAQDAILEPFGGDLFGLSVGETTRFNAYYYSGVLLTMMVGSALTRQWPPQKFTGVTAGGLVAIAATLGLLAAAALGRVESLLVPGLFLFGIASGIYTVGGLSLMIAMTDERHAGAYLGLWSMAQLVFRGVGIALGGLVLDVVRNLTGSPEWGYASVFLMEIIAALVALAFLARVARIGYLYTPRLRAQEPLAALD